MKRLSRAKAVGELPENSAKSEPAGSSSSRTIDEERFVDLIAKANHELKNELVGQFTDELAKLTERLDERMQAENRKSGGLAWRLFGVALAVGFGSWGFSSLATYLVWDWQASVVFFVLCGIGVVGLMWYWFIKR